MEYIERQTRSVIVDGMEYDLELMKDILGKWTVLGPIPIGGGTVIAGCNTRDDAIERWLRTVPNRKK